MVQLTIATLLYLRYAQNWSDGGVWLLPFALLGMIRNKMCKTVFEMKANARTMY